MTGPFTLTYVLSGTAIVVSGLSVVVARRARRRSEESFWQMRRANQVGAMRRKGVCPNCQTRLAYIDWDATTYRSHPCGCRGTWDASLRGTPRD